MYGRSVTMIALFLFTGTLSLAGCKKSAPAPVASKAPVQSDRVRLSPEVRKAMAMETAILTARKLPMSLEALGDVAARPDAEAVLHAPFDGILVQVRSGVGDRVQKGQTLAVIRSAELGRAQAAYLKALGEEKLALREYQRQQQLLRASLASRREFEEASQKHEGAKVALAQALEELRVYGIDGAAIARLAARGRVDPVQELRSPTAGTITARKALKGSRVAPNDADPIFKVIDLSVVRIETDIPERSWQFVRKGQAADVFVDAYRAAPLTGHVVRISPILDPQSHTGKASIDVPNPKGALRPGMSARVSLNIGSQEVLAVPAAAVQQEGEKIFVVRAMSDGSFLETPVKAGRRSGDWVPVLQGLNKGDKVVTKGSFDLRAEARKASFGGE